MHVMNFDSNDRQVNLLLRWFFWGVAPLVLVSCNSEDPSSECDAIHLQCVRWDSLLRSG